MSDIDNNEENLNKLNGEISSENAENPVNNEEIQNHNSRLEELLSSYDPNIPDGAEGSAFNVNVNEVMDQVTNGVNLQPTKKAKHENTILEEDDISLGQTFDKQEDELVTVKPIKFANFENEQFVVGMPKKNLDIMQDINIKVTAELGRCRMKLKKVLDIQKGSIIEINKVAGEQVELFVMGKIVAYGEVVVMEDKFGLRITSIVEDKQL